MNISRVWAMPNKWTFEIEPIAELLMRYVGDGQGWADPFAGQSTLAEHRNDLNTVNGQPSAVEASTFLGGFAAESLNGVIFDPPYSLTQVSRSYSEIGRPFNSLENPTGGFPLVRDEIARIVKNEGVCVAFGWNTVGMGIKRGFSIVEILIVSHGGNRNDTLCTVEIKTLNSVKPPRPSLLCGPLWESPSNDR